MEITALFIVNERKEFMMPQNQGQFIILLIYLIIFTSIFIMVQIIGRR